MEISRRRFHRLAALSGGTALLMGKSAALFSQTARPPLQPFAAQARRYAPRVDVRVLRPSERVVL